MKNDWTGVTDCGGVPLLMLEKLCLSLLPILEAKLRGRAVKLLLEWTESFGKTTQAWPGGSE